jgi:AraC-like DNA-binding protein/quercetin dioxygenase-like cupin family protein
MWQTYHEMTKIVAKRPSLPDAVRRPPGHPGEQRGAPQVTGLASNYIDGASTGWHSHYRAQLAFAVSGVMHVDTEQGAFVVPPQRALWLPAGMRHSIAMHGAVGMRTIYVAPETARSLPAMCRVVAITPLLRELMLEAVRLPLAYRPNSRAGRLNSLLLDELRALPILPLHLPLPEDARLRRVCDSLLENLALDLTLEELASAASTSPRTLARLFRSETGMSFGQWRQQARLLEALRLLASGEKVTSVAMDLGYDSPSAFTSMFRKALGVPPSRYFGEG